jgi:hypothetical protein
MNGSRPGRWWLITFAAVALTMSATAQNTANVSPQVQTFQVPAALMPPPSPVDYFRNLLDMSPEQRENILANKPPAVRARIMAKVNEYDALDPRTREVRLQATEIRWFLTPMLRASPAERQARLAIVPDNIRDLVKSRLMRWEILPPTLQREFLENEHTLEYFSGVQSTNNVSGEAVLSDEEQARWNALSGNQQKAMTVQFDQFFELSPDEKEKALETLSANDRQQMLKTVQAFDKLAPSERSEYISALSRFAGMTPAQRAEFLKNAQLWSQMSPTERKAWDDLVHHVPQWPPMSIMPPMPPALHTVAVTNRS